MRSRLGVWGAAGEEKEEASVSVLSLPASCFYSSSCELRALTPNSTCKTVLGNAPTAFAWLVGVTLLFAVFPWCLSELNDQLSSPTFGGEDWGEERKSQERIQVLLNSQWDYVPINPSYRDNIGSQKCYPTQPGLACHKGAQNPYVGPQVGTLLQHEEHTVKGPLFTFTAAWLMGAVAGCHCPAPGESIRPHIAMPGKGQNSKNGFCWMCMASVPLQSLKVISRTSKSGDVCTTGNGENTCQGPGSQVSSSPHACWPFSLRERWSVATGSAAAGWIWPPIKPAGCERASAEHKERCCEW